MLEGTFEEKAAKALALAIVIACLITVGVYLFSQEKPTGHSVAYFKPENLSSQLANGHTSFTLVIENLEEKETIYSIYYYANDVFLERESLVLGSQSTTELKKEFGIEKLNLEKPVKIKARIEAPKRNLELFYWING